MSVQGPKTTTVGAFGPAICPSCGRNILHPHPTNLGGARVCCRGWLAQITADPKQQTTQ
jgi:hypothetical protein